MLFSYLIFILHENYAHAIHFKKKTQEKDKFWCFRTVVVNLSEDNNNHIEKENAPPPSPLTPDPTIQHALLVGMNKSIRLDKLTQR